MKTSTAGLMALISHEGIVLSRYKDSKGVWTIGVGHTKAAGGLDPSVFTGELTVAQAFQLFRTDVANYEAGVAAALKVSVAQHEFDALVSFHYNTGGIARATLTKKLNAGDHVGAAAAFMNWVTPPEIRERREAERDLFALGTYPAPYANLYPAVNGRVQWSQGRRADLRPLVGEAQEPPAQPVRTDRPVLRQGSKGDDVRELQRALIALGYDLGRAGADGDFGPKTKGAVLYFQKDRGLYIDGIVGKQTWTALGLA